MAHKHKWEPFSHDPGLGEICNICGRMRSAPTGGLMDFETQDDLYRDHFKTLNHSHNITYLSEKLEKAWDEITRLQVQNRQLWITIGYLHAAPPESLRRLALDHKDLEDEAQMEVDNR